MKLPTSSAGLFQHRVNLRPTRVTLDREALGDGLEIGGCVGCGGVAATEPLNLKVAQTVLSWRAVLGALLAAPLVFGGGIGVVVVVAALLQQSAFIGHRTPYRRG